MAESKMGDRLDRVLVTGGAGFIGSHIVDALVADGCDVGIVDNLHTGRRENINPAARFYQVDIRDRAALETVFEQERPELVCHQAALANVRASVDQPDVYASVNVIGTLHLMELAHKYQVHKFVMASTGGAIYGDSAPLPADESCPPHPLDPYGVSKLSAEHYLFACHHNHGLRYCALRYGNVYGPRQNPDGEAGVVAIFSGRMLNGAPATINGDGGQQRDFVYVADVARANVMALSLGNGIYNIGTGITTDVNTIYRTLAELTGYQQPETHGDANPAEVRAISLDSTRAWNELGWKPQISLAEGLAMTVDSMRSLYAKI